MIILFSLYFLKMEENELIKFQINALIDYEFYHDMTVALSEQIENKDIINKNVINGIILDENYTLEGWIYIKIAELPDDDNIEPFISGVIEIILKPYLMKLNIGELIELFSKVEYTDKSDPEWIQMIDQIKESLNNLEQETSQFGKIFTGNRGGRYYKRNGRKIYIY